MKRTTIFILSIFAISININAQVASGKLLLTKGQKFQLDNTLKTSTGFDMMGQTMEMTADVNMVHDIEVKDKTDSSFFINSTLTKMKSNANAMGQNQSFDSDKKEDFDSEAGKLMKGIMNVAKEAEFDKSAKLLSVKKDTSTSANTGDMMNMLQGFMSGAEEDASGAAEAFMVIPAGKKTGDMWSDSIITEGLKIYRNFTLKEIKGNDATVVFSGNQITEKKIEQMGMEVNVNMDAKLTGESLTDIHTGVLKQKTFNMEGTGTAEMMGQSIPMTTKITSTTLVKGK